MKPLLALIAIALAGCVETGDRKMEGGARDDELLPRIDALLQVDLFDRAAIEERLGVRLQPQEMATIPPSVAYVSSEADLAPFSEVEYENRDGRFAYLHLWLDDARCFPSEEIEDKYDFATSTFAHIDIAEEKRGVVVGNIFPLEGRKLRIGYRKTDAGDYCVKKVTIRSD
jgi:hypothetical protein